MKKEEAAICPNCEWTGDAIGMADCPLCGASLASLDAYDEENDLVKKQDKYPDDIINREEEDFGMM